MGQEIKHLQIKTLKPFSPSQAKVSWLQNPKAIMDLFDTTTPSQLTWTTHSVFTGIAIWSMQKKNVWWDNGWGVRVWEQGKLGDSLGELSIWLLAIFGPILGTVWCFKGLGVVPFQVEVLDFTSFFSVQPPWHKIKSWESGGTSCSRTFSARNVHNELRQRSNFKSFKSLCQSVVSSVQYTLHNRREILTFTCVPTDFVL